MLKFSSARTPSTVLSSSSGDTSKGVVDNHPAMNLEPSDPGDISGLIPHPEAVSETIVTTSEFGYSR